ncbi:MAG: hypothetical protein LRZ88_08550 [Candidatus Cloacimonetes bacterium]|nr:hypothetical protein [Candidatus Cloacimonadota bacterium]
MKIVFTASGEGWDARIDPRFGRTDYILVYDEKRTNSAARIIVRSKTWNTGPGQRPRS